jgi:hypothetical protein
MIVLLTFGFMMMVFGLILAFLLVVYSRTQLPQTIGIPIYEQRTSVSTSKVLEQTAPRLDNERVHPENTEVKGVVG